MFQCPRQQVLINIRQNSQPTIPTQTVQRWVSLSKWFPVRKILSQKTRIPIRQLPPSLRPNSHSCLGQDLAIGPVLFFLDLLLFLLVEIKQLAQVDLTRPAGSCK